MTKEKTEKQKSLTPREAAQDFIRPYVLKSDTMPLHPSAKLRHETKNYSAHIEETGNVVITKLYGEAIEEKFSLKEIMNDVTLEFIYGKGMTNFTAPTAKEAYALREKEIKLLLKELKVKLKKHRKDFKNYTSNWGYVGDLGHISSKLKEIVLFLH
ncbi:MAG: hypothetical protein HY841_05400 [Bacteroidetes bacterium]|nr:hypothetical protein [Bacteroidota bacterium]